MLNSFTPIWERVEPSFAAVNLPYVFTDIKHVRRAFDGPIGKQYEERLLKRGVRVLTGIPGAFRELQTVRPVKGLADMKGLKLRAVQAPTFLDTFKLLGADPVASSSKEVYLSLQSGLVEGLDAPLGVLLGWKTHEIAKYVAITHHMYNHGYILINERVYQRLTPEQQAIVTAGAKDAAAWYDAQYDKFEADIEAELVRQGVTITRPDLAPFRKAVLPIYTKYGTAPEVADVLKRIKALEQ
jgi:TRAP-type C4-dicarboxylate transport system substrate-binding protein